MPDLPNFSTKNVIFYLMKLYSQQIIYIGIFTFITYIFYFIIKINLNIFFSSIVQFEQFSYCLCVNCCDWFS